MHGVLATKKAMSSPDSQGTTFIDPAVASKRNTQMAMPVPATNEETLETPKATVDPECDEEEVEDDTYVPPEGEGCFSFRQSLLLRAKDTYSARSIGNKFEIISNWLLTGLLSAQLAYPCQKTHAYDHSQRSTQGLLPTGIPG